MVKWIVKFVDWCLVIKRLKVFLFILFIILILLIINSIANLICIDEKVFASYMIGLSALFASTVAMINLRISYINKESEKHSEITSVIHNSLVRIAVLESKLGLYKLMLNGTKPLDNILLENYEKLLSNIMEIITDKDIAQYINANNSDLIYSVHDSLFLALSNNRTRLNKIEKNPKLNGTKLPSQDSNKFCPADHIQKSLTSLRDIILEFKEKQEKIMIKINNEERY
jgi:hypothetical protein